MTEPSAPNEPQDSGRSDTNGFVVANNSRRPPRPRACDPIAARVAEGVPGAFAYMHAGCQFYRQKEQGSRVFLHLQMHDTANEKHYSVIEISKLWALSQRTVRRIFENEPGVIVWGCPETRRKRGYRTMRVPESVLLRVHRRMRQNL